MNIEINKLKFIQELLQKCLERYPVPNDAGTHSLTLNADGYPVLTIRIVTEDINLFVPCTFDMEPDDMTIEDIFNAVDAFLETYNSQ
jgi:hypothetical protein